jgi:S1-C subfamily serine protease
MLTCCLAALALLPGQVEITPSTQFSRRLQTAAVTATVRIANVGQGSQGSGVVIARKGRFALVLTAGHIVREASRLEVATFSVGSYPSPEDVYRSAEVLAVAADVRDLALLRVPVGDKEVGQLDLCPRALVPEQSGFSALAVGCAGGAAPTCLIDKVLASKRVRRETAAGSALFWEVDQKYPGGRSGGPLIDARGHLLGVLSGTSKGRSYFCHAEVIRAFLKEAGVE